MKRFRLPGCGLEPGVSCPLTVNNIVLDTNITDADGKLHFTKLPIGAEDVLPVRAIAIWDGAGNNVLSTPPS